MTSATNGRRHITNFCSRERRQDMATQSGNSPSVRSPGDASFNGVDRLAIINLFGSYAQSYDASKLDEFISLFMDKAELKYMNGDKVAADGLAQVTAAMPERVKAIKAAKMQRRHALTLILHQPNRQRGQRESVFPSVFEQGRRRSVRCIDRLLRIHGGQGGEYLEIQSLDRPCGSVFRLRKATGCRALQMARCSLDRLYRDPGRE